MTDPSGKTTSVPTDEPQIDMTESSPSSMDFMSPPAFHLNRLNKRLEEASSQRDEQWWDTLMFDFFEDDASLSVCFQTDTTPECCTFNRTLIPRYFQSFYDVGAVGLSFILCDPQETFNDSSNSVTVVCQETTMVTCFETPASKKVNTHGCLTFDFSSNQLMRIRTWHFMIHDRLEKFLEQVLQNPSLFFADVMRSEIASSTIDCLRQGAHEEEMRESVSEPSTSSTNARDTLRKCDPQKQLREKPPETGCVEKKTPKKQKYYVVGEPTIMAESFDKEMDMITPIKNPVAIETEQVGKSLTSCTASPAVHHPQGGAMSLQQQGHIPAPQLLPSWENMSQPGTSGQSIPTTIQPGSAPHPAMYHPQGQGELQLRNVEKDAMSPWQPGRVPAPQFLPSHESTPQPGTSRQGTPIAIQPELALYPAMYFVQGQGQLQVGNADYSFLDLLNESSEYYSCESSENLPQSSATE